MAEDYKSSQCAAGDSDSSVICIYLNNKDVYMNKKYDLTQFKKDIDELDIVLSEKQIEQFITYYEMLVEWNNVMNLTAITEYEDVMKKHFIDSISLIKAYDVTKNVSVIDVGTGAGFPGLALKIAYPNLKITLLDSLNKRINFLDAVIEKLGLSDIDTIHGRAEDYAKKGKLREDFDLCVSRAVANLSTLSEYCLPFVKVGGKFISYKSEKITEEMNNATGAISILGGKIVNQVEFMLPNSDIYRNLFVIDKVKETPSKYPRKAGMASKEPLK
jgi:16S rRNA (guanine527-N7)-methyltransferase